MYYTFLFWTSVLAESIRHMHGATETVCCHACIEEACTPPMYWGPMHVHF